MIREASACGILQSCDEGHLQTKMSLSGRITRFRLSSRWVSAVGRVVSIWHSAQSGLSKCGGHDKYALLVRSAMSCTERRETDSFKSELTGKRTSE